MGKISTAIIGGLAGITSCPCPFCYGQARIYEEAKNGEGLIPTPCNYCLATGSVLTFGAW